MTRAEVKIGAKLTIKTPMSAERMGKCNAHGCAACNQITYPHYRQVEPGTVGVVGAILCPAVTRNKDFLCLDFTIDGHTWRMRPWYHEVFPCN